MKYYLTRNSLQRTSKLPMHHILNRMALSTISIQRLEQVLPSRAPADNLWIATGAVAVLPPLHLTDHITCVGDRLLDRTCHIQITVPSAPPRSSKVFEQWATSWIQQAYADSHDKTIIGMDGSYTTRGQGSSAFVVQTANAVTHTHSCPVAAHSSYDTKMQATSMVIEYITDHIRGKILVFIDNQSTLKALFNVKHHSLFELARLNSIAMQKWIDSAPHNEIEFRWMPSHLGFHINKLADKAAGSLPIGPFPNPIETITSCIRHNRAAVVNKWRQAWRPFAVTKRLQLKFKKKQVLPNAWDSKSKIFMCHAHDIVTYSRFNRLVTGHAPTGEFRQRFFPHEPQSCTCFARFQSHAHLLTECPKYISKFSSMISFHVSNKNANKILTFLKDNPTAYTFEDKPIDLYDPP